ncbi:MAG: UDP-N-acetylmuramoyl-tripeptide--D-alanyl-D-alanine ligase [Xanthomonadales bacterium]|nr:UDP-N-acetylmuramoyl-tripeptide--D-alanyl-D-alanine ligase [Xanthomonadales bacterium]
MRLDFNTAAKALGCVAPAQEGGFEGVTIDSRAVQPGQLFAALPGARADGHDFVNAAAHSGAAAALVSRAVEHDIPQLLVEDVQIALGVLARHWRAQCGVHTVAITGSNGKTTTKEMVANILAGTGKTLATQGNLNNELGVPLTLFGLAPEHRFAVLEMGAARAGDIHYLAGIASPDVGLVTNVGPAHLQGFGSEEGVARAKGEIYQGLGKNGTAVINADEPWHPLWRDMADAGTVLTFGRGTDNDVSLTGTDARPLVRTPDGEFPLQLSLPGAHNVQNALAATAVAIACGCPVEQVRRGLEATCPVPGRLNMVHSEHGWIVIDDTYNANPASLYAALQVLARQQGERWLVLGDMKELGRDSRKLHAEMGEAARALGVSRLFAIGDASHATVDAFGTGGRHFADLPALIEQLRSELQPGIACLVKGSRSMGMERVVAAIGRSEDMREAG